MGEVGDMTGPWYPFEPSGLMRCCLRTLAMAYDPAEPAVDEVQAVEGAKLPCRACSTTMIFLGGMWRWDKSRAQPPSPPEAELAD
jgi:hypothetical protein